MLASSGEAIPPCGVPVTVRSRRPVSVITGLQERPHEPQNALVIDEDKLDELGDRKFMGIINDVNGRLTTSAMIQMNRDVEVDGQDEAIVAERFLRSAGLLEGGS
jgi:hypothetical protein